MKTLGIITFALMSSLTKPLSLHGFKNKKLQKTPFTSEKWGPSKLVGGTLNPSYIFYI